MKEQLRAFLTIEGYTTVVSNLPEFLVFLKKEYRHVCVLFVIELEKESTFSKERYQSVYDSACALLEKNGVTEMHILTLIITDDVKRALEVCEGDKYAWVINRSEKELVIAQDKVVDFYGHKALYERFLMEPQAAQNKIKEAEQKALTERKEQEKQKFCKRYVPWVAYTLIAVNIVTFIVCTATGNMLYNVGEMSLSNTVGEGQWYRLITSMFLHGNLTHLFNNMLILYLLGDMIEERIGRWKFLVFYFICGVTAGLVSLGAKYLSGVDACSLGASGAVYGIFGIALVTEFMSINWRKVRVATLQRLLLVILFVIVSLYVDAHLDNVDYEAHVGGLCMGAIIGMIWYINQLGKKRDKKHEN